MNCAVRGARWVGGLRDANIPAAPCQRRASATLFNENDSSQSKAQRQSERRWIAQTDGTWLARLKSPPIDGKANQELLLLIARHFGCAKSAVSIKSGASGRVKLVRIEGD